MGNKTNEEQKNDKMNKIKNYIDNTITNYNETEKIIAQTCDEEEKYKLEIKNMRKEKALEDMKQEIKNIK